MKKKNYIALIVSTLVCLLFLIVMIVGTYTLREYKKYDIVFLGDSIFGNVRDATSIPALVESNIGKSCFNAGLGGTSAATFGNRTKTDIIESSASLYYLSDAFKNKENSCILAMQPIKPDGDLDYFDEAVKDICKLDISSAEVIFIEHGLNDYFYGIEIGDENSGSDTYYGALSESIDNLKKASPDARIILVTPVSADSEVAKYADAMIAVSKVKGVEVIDMYREGIVTSINVSESTIDGTHLSIDARKKYAQILSEYLK